MEINAPANIRLYPSSGRSPVVKPREARMNESSPICDKLTDTVRAVLSGYRKISTRINATSDFPRIMIATATRMRNGSSSKIFGSNNMPTDKKQHRKCISEWQRFLRSAMAQTRLTHHHAREKCTQCKKHQIVSLRHKQYQPQQQRRRV